MPHIYSSSPGTLPSWIFDLKRYNIPLTFDTESFTVQTPWKNQRIYWKHGHGWVTLASELHIQKSGGRVLFPVPTTAALVEVLFYSWVSQPRYTTDYWDKKWIKLFRHYGFLSCWDVFFITMHKHVPIFWDDFVKVLFRRN